MSNSVTLKLPAKTADSTEAFNPDSSFEGSKRTGLILAFVVFGVFGVWASVAPIEGAAHAVGVVKVKSHTKVVQHLEGGIVSSIQVQNGDMVNAGDVLLILDDTQAQSQLEIVTGRLTASSALEARLIAERDNRDVVQYPATLTATSANAQSEMLAQDQVFNARKTSREGFVAVLGQRISQLNSRLGGLRALDDSKQTLAASYDEELTEVRKLVKQGYADKQRLRELERAHAMLSGESADLKSTIASTQIQIGETRLQIIQQDNEFQTLVVNQLAETQAALKDARERFIALTDIVQRKEIKASAAGIVNSLQVHTDGGVIPPGGTIADIVPQGADLVIEAQISPADIDRVEIGQEATIRFSTFSTTSVPTVFGHVITLSAETLTDPVSGHTYYLARVELTPESLVALDSVILVPGMPAETFINSGSRTLLQYVTKPLANVVSRSLIED